MKWSKTLHALTVIVGVVGFLALLGAWIAGESGTFAGFSQSHLFSDAQNSFLLSITLGVGVLIHQNIEKK